MLQLRHPHVLQMIGFASDGAANSGILMELMEANLSDVLYVHWFAAYNSWEGSLLVLASDVSKGMACLAPPPRTTRRATTKRNERRRQHV
jgi:hypothetical protein